MKTNASNVKKNKSNRLQKKAKRVKRRLARRRRQTRLPAAFTKGTPKTFNTISMNGTTATVEGSDLIYKIPDSIVADTATNVITMIPANPAYWTGTRIAAIAAGYQNYRPLNFTVHYVPQCAVTQQGNVIAGTLWNEVPTAANLQQTLKTSNGGILTQCYKPATSVIRMKSNLQFNLFRMGGAIDQQSNPFMYIAMQIGCKNQSNQSIIPGYFYIQYRYMFKNPIGTGISYTNTGLTTITSQTFQANAVLYATTSHTMNSIPIEIGSRIDIEKSETGYDYYYNGTRLGNSYSQPAWILENQPINQISRTTTMFKSSIEYSQVVVLPEDREVIIPYNSFITYENDNYIVTIFNADEDTDIKLPQDVEYAYIPIIPNDLGPVTQQDILASIIIFEAPKTAYRLHGNPTKFKIYDKAPSMDVEDTVHTTITTKDNAIIKVRRKAN